ncbi:hypothetical protein D3C75_711520 [compost metagenome]
MRHAHNDMQFIHIFMCPCPQGIRIDGNPRQPFRQYSKLGLVPKRSDGSGNLAIHPDGNTAHQQSDPVPLQFLILP